MSEVMNAPMQLEVGDKVVDFVKLQPKVYENKVQHMYGIDENNKKYHISHLSVLESHGYDKTDLAARKKETAAHQASALIEDAAMTDEPGKVISFISEPKGKRALEGEITPRSPKAEKTSPETDRTKHDILPEAVGATAIAASTEAARVEKRSWKERFAITKRKVAVAAGALAVVAASAFAHFTVGNDKSPMERDMAAVSKTVDTKLANATVKVGSEVKPAPAESEKAVHEAAIGQKLTEIGLSPEQVTEVTNFDSALPGPQETGIRSLNRGHGWENHAYTVNGAKQMGSDLLSGQNGYSAVDAQIAREALASKGVPQDVIDKLAKNDFADLGIKAYTINSSTATYHNIAFHNVLDKLAFDANRAVGANDAFMIISYKADGVVKTVAVRVDCSGDAQVFDTITVPQQAVRQPETPKEAPKETPKETTTSTTPSTTVTTEKPTTTTHPNTTTTHPNTTTTHPNTTTTHPNTTTTHPNTTTTHPNTTTTNLGPKKPGTHPPREIPTTVPADPEHGHDPTTSTVKPRTTSSTSPANTTVSTTAPESGRTSTTINND